MKFPDVEIIDHKGLSVGIDVISAIKKGWPKNSVKNASIIFRWGQKTLFPDDKNIVIFDCGYFSREYSEKRNRHFRLSINETHPTKLPPAPGDRWQKHGIQLEDLFDPNGHVLLIGRGGKTRKAQGIKGENWEQDAFKKIMKILPESKVIYRPKKNTADRIKGAKLASPQSTIRDLCQGCSLIYTQRSNVGNEGLVYGIPVVTEGGPAADICSNRITPGMEPLSHDMRLEFLHRLAYWQWSYEEIERGDIWPWLLDQIKLRSKFPC